MDNKIYQEEAQPPKKNKISPARLVMCSLAIFGITNFKIISKDEYNKYQDMIKSYDKTYTAYQEEIEKNIKLSKEISNLQKQLANKNSELYGFYGNGNNTSYSLKSNNNTCYFTKSGKSYHLNPNCYHIKNREVYYATVSEAIAMGHADPCDDCSY